MIATVTTAEAISGLLALFVIVVAVLTFARILLKREALAWHRLRIGFFVERDRSAHERDRDQDEYDWEPLPPRDEREQD